MTWVLHWFSSQLPRLCVWKTFRLTWFVNLANQLLGFFTQCKTSSCFFFFIYNFIFIGYLSRLSMNTYYIFILCFSMKMDIVRDLSEAVLLEIINCFFLLPPSPESCCPYVILKASTEILVRGDHKMVLEEETALLTDVNHENQNVFLLTFLLVFILNSLRNYRKCWNVISIVFLYWIFVLKISSCHRKLYIHQHQGKD